MEVFILSHGYDYGDIFDKYKWNEESRVLGVYYTKREALKALSKYQKIKGFSFFTYKNYLFTFRINLIPNSIFFLGKKLKTTQKISWGNKKTNAILKKK